VVIGDLSQRQMVMKEHEAKQRFKHRAVFNDWGTVWVRADAGVQVSPGWESTCQTR
jgi:hypothetical protein